jgi:hypothetical protein
MTMTQNYTCVMELQMASYRMITMEVKDEIN